MDEKKKPFNPLHLKIKFDSSSRNGSTNVMVKQLGLFLDQENIVRCQGRINRSALLEPAKQPIFLPTKNRFTELVICEKYEVVHHDGI